MRISASFADFNRGLSDMLRELTDLYVKVMQSQALQDRKLRLNPQIREGNVLDLEIGNLAPIEITQTYDYFMGSGRFRVNIFRRIVNIIYILALLLLISAVSLSLLTYSPHVQDAALSLSLTSLMLAVPLPVVGWYLAEHQLSKFSTELLHTRHQLYGELFGVSRYLL